MKGLFRISGILKQVVQTKTSTRSLSTSFHLFSYQRQVLSDEEVDQYKRTGYVVLRDLLTPQEKTSVQQYMDEIENWPLSEGKWYTYFEEVNGKKHLSRIDKFADYHEGMKGLIHGKIGQAVSDLVEEPVCLFKDKVNFKMPGGIGYDAHQDEPSYDMFKQGLHMAALVCADPMTMENGCLSVVAGDWKEGEFLKLDERGDIDEEVAKHFKYDHILGEAGTVVLFNSLVPHKSGPNKTNKARRAYYITWNGISRGDFRDQFYGLRKVLFPSDHERDPSKDYSYGMKLFSEETLAMGNNIIERTDKATTRRL